MGTFLGLDRLLGERVPRDIVASLTAGGRGAQASLSDMARLEFDLCPELDDALGRNLEVIRRADGIAPHEGV